MCMEIKFRRGADDKLRPDRTLPKSKRGWITVWKIMRVDTYFNSISSPTYCLDWRVGINKSTRDSTKLDTEREGFWSLGRGIHVFLKRPPKREANSWNDKHVVRLQVKRKDFVARGWQAFRGRTGLPQAVFTKATLTKKDWNDAMKRARRGR